MEKLYNNILLPDNFADQPSSPEDVPYLKNPPEVIDISVGRQLFVDDFLIEKTTLQPVFHKAKKYDGNPVLKAETEWENDPIPVACPKSGGIWYDEEEKIFKAWYEAGWLRHSCYAVSKDGLHWERPDLGFVKGTNIILPYEGFELEKQIKEGVFEGDLSFLRPDSNAVFIDYSAPAAERYKLFMRNPGGMGRGMAAVSRDGLHFEKFRFTNALGDRSTIFYNPFRKKWVYSIRSIETNETGWYRARRYRECDDFLAGATWDASEEHRWLSCDALDKPNPYIGMTPQLYNVDCVGYESIMLGMFQVTFGPENNICEAHGVPKITELIPMYSRDGYHFSRPCRDSIINASVGEGTWDRGYVQSVGGVTIIRGDELWIYYIGFAGDRARAGQSAMTNGMYSGGATGIAKLRRDGFVSLCGDGTLLTRKVCFTEKNAMYINASGRVQVQLLDAEGGEIATSRVFDGDSTKAEVVFDSYNVSTLSGHVFRIRFIVDGALYAFGFADATGNFGGASAAGEVIL
ncbi:MAG: glycosyl hydrolase family 32 [Ruminococcaceae bacterium]|nr:glycosyl hydrolase family 32 [Oscillospiraceae bacterium]